MADDTLDADLLAMAGDESSEEEGLEDEHERSPRESQSSTAPNGTKSTSSALAPTRRSNEQIGTTTNKSGRSSRKEDPSDEGEA